MVARMSHTADRITDGLRYLVGEFSADRDEFRRNNQPHGAALLDACQNLGYVARGQTAETRDRVALTAAGRRRLAAVEAPPSAED
jgi:hypothetical protein